MTSDHDSALERHVSSRLVSTLVIGGIGVVTFAFHLLHLLLELDELLAVGVGILPPMIISIALVGGAYWLWQSPLEKEYHPRIIAWTGVGSVGIAGIGASTIIYQWAHGTPQTDIPFMVVNWSVTGAFGGFLIGVYEARQRNLADSLRQERDEVAAREREIKREVERLDRFASIISHDLRNPLNVAKGRLELVRETCDSEDLDTVASALDRMDGIIDDVLTMAREGQEVPEDEREPVNLADCAESCWEHVATADASLEIEGDFTMNADRSRLREVFENLYRNAVEHGGEDVTIRVGPLPADTGFYVEDDGPGFPSDEERVFEPGYTTRDNGTGLGLSIVQEIITGHGWEIRAVEGNDGGARFEITGLERS